MTTATYPVVSPSAASIGASRIRELAEVAMGMEGVLKLYFGESNLPTPAFLKEAAKQALAEGYTYYTENAGLLSLRQALAEYYQRQHHVSLDPQREIIVTASGVEALHLGIRAVLDPGDEAIILTPAWPNGSANVEMANAVPRHVPLVLTGTRYTLDFDAMERAVTPRTRLLLFTSPSNPLGWTATEEEQRQTLAFCRKHNLWLMSDEVYERLTYEVPYALSMLRYATRDDAVLVVQSFSKAYCMTGWRLGWLIGPQRFVEKTTSLNEYVVSCAASFTQRVGEIALRDGEASVAEQRARLRQNRDACLQALRGMPHLTVPEPEGAFYLFPQVAGLQDSFAFCKQLLQETRVGLAPGVGFGEGGEGSIRLCYAAELPLLQTALERIGDFLQRYRP